MLDLNWVKLPSQVRLSIALSWGTVLIAVGAFAAPAPALAQAGWTPTNGTGVWCTVRTGGADGCVYQNPKEACIAQHMDYGGPGQLYENKKNDSDWTVEQCNWEFIIGNSLPAIVWYQCPDGYFMEPTGFCSAEPYPECVCDETQPHSPHPINILTGSKRFRADDFETADGALSVGRTFVSHPFSAQGRNIGAPRLSFGNWLADFDVQLHLSDRAWDTVQVAGVTNPDGTSQNFGANSSGVFSAAGFSQSSSYDKNTSLQYVGTWTPGGSGIINATSQWLYTDRNNLIWTLQTVLGTDGKYRRGRPTSVQRPDGTVLAYSYDATGALTTITDQTGNSITLTWNVINAQATTVSEVTLPGSYKLKYYYENATGVTSTAMASRLSKVEWLNATAVVQDSVSYKHEYAPFPFYVTSILDKNLATRWKVSYDSEGRATRSEGPNGEFLEAIAYSRTSTTSTRVRTDALGRQRTYSFTHPLSDMAPQLTSVAQAASANAPASTQSNTYTGYKIASSTDEEGRVTTYTRNTKYQPTQIVEGYGTTSARTTGMTWATYFNLPIQTVETGLTTNYNYDGQARLTGIVQQDTTTQTVPYATGGQTRTWTYTWGTTAGAKGKVISIDGPLSGTGDSKTFTYNANGYLQTATNEVGKVTTVTSWDWRGAPLTVTDPNSVSTTFTYDIHGRVLTMTVNPGANQSLYTFQYDVIGNLTKVILPKGGYLQYTYDSASRLTVVTNDRGETVTYTPNAIGQPTLSVVKNASAAITQQQGQVYDELGRVIQILGAASTTPTGIGYDKVGNPKTLTDGRSKTYTTGFDPLNRVITETNPDNESVKYGYNALDVVVDHKDGRNLQTTFVTNGFGEVIREVSPDRGTRTYWYDAAGRMTKLVDGDSEETDFTYDNAGRMLTQTFPGSSFEDMTYTYDSTASGNKGNGRLTSVTEQSGSTAFTYDEQGRVTKDAKTIQGLTYNVQYAYDTNGGITQITLPSGRVVTYTRANDGLVTGITTKPTAAGTVSNVATSITHQPFGDVKGLTFGNGLALANTYNLNGWRTRTRVTGASATTFDLSYDYYDDGSLGEIVDNAATGRTVYMDLSDSGRLTYAGGPWGQHSFNYDAAGNRTGNYLTVGGVSTPTNEITSGSSNRLVKTTDGAGVTKRTLTYRAGGDLYTDALAGGTTFEYLYSSRKRLVVIKQAGLTVASYGYDFRGQRVWRTINGIPTNTNIHYVFDGQGHLLSEQNGGTGAVIREYIWLNDTPVAVIDSSSGTATTYYVHTGHLDEPQVMTNAAKAKVWDAYVTPFGSAKVFTTASANVDIRLPGQWFQAEAAGSGLNQNRYRDYDPSLGRYIEADPIGLNGGQNPYAYVDGDVYDATGSRGLIVKVEERNPALAKKLQDAYKNLNARSPHAQKWNKRLERSKRVYKIRYAAGVSEYCNPISMPNQPRCHGMPRSILVDPCLQLLADLVGGGQQYSDFEIILAHELAHAYADEINGQGQFGTEEDEEFIVKHYENPIRRDYGEADRTLVPEITVRGGARK